MRSGLQHHLRHVWSARLWQRRLLGSPLGGNDEFIAGSGHRPCSGCHGHPTSRNTGVEQRFDDTIPATLTGDTETGDNLGPAPAFRMVLAQRLRCLRCPQTAVSGSAPALQLRYGHVRQKGETATSSPAMTMMSRHWFAPTLERGTLSSYIDGFNRAVGQVTSSRG